MRMCLSIASLSFAVALTASAFAAGREKGAEPAARVIAAPEEAKAGAVLPRFRYYTLV